MRGYDVMARPSWGYSDPMLKVANWLSAFEYSPLDIKGCSGRTVEEVTDKIDGIMKSFGENSRAIIWFEWENRSSSGGHAIVSAYFENGKVGFGDPQFKSRAAVKHLNSAKLESVVLLRIDNLKFTNIVKRCCMNRGEQL